MPLFSKQVSPDKWQKFCTLISSGDVVGVRALLSENHKLVKAKGNSNQTLLHEAARSGQVSVAELLLTKGAEVDARDKSRATPLHWAVAQGKIELAELLIARGAKVDTQDEQGRTLLHSAAWDGQPDVARTLLSQGADANARDRSGATPLWVLSSTSSRVRLYGDDLYEKLLEVAKLLIAHGAEVDALDNWLHYTPLCRAAYDGLDRVAELLLEHGADINFRDKRHGDTPLHVAVMQGYTSVVRVLLAHGADTALWNGRNMSPMDLAVSFHHSEIQALLLAHKEAVLRGDFGKPYCSRKCYDEAGRLIAELYARGMGGVCTFCQSPVRFGPSDTVTNCACIPHGTSQMLFVCERCLDRGVEYVREMKQCCLCGHTIQ